MNCLTVSNLKLDDVFIDVFGKSSRAITEYIWAYPEKTFDVTPFIHSYCKTLRAEIQAAAEGAISSEQAVKLRSCLGHVDQMEEHRHRLSLEIQRICEPFETALNLLRTIPGMNSDPMKAITVLSEIGSDMSVFSSAKHLCSWTGCCPRNDQSDGKIQSTRIPRSGTYLKPVLV